MVAWDRHTPSSLARSQDEAVREQVRDVVAPFAPYWRERFSALGIAPGSIDGVAALGRLPAIGERDVAPDGDPARLAGLVVQVGEQGWAEHVAGPSLRRALLLRLVDRDGYRRAVEDDVRPTSYLFAGLGLRFPLASTRGDLDAVARAGARLWRVLGLTAADPLVSAVPVAASVEHRGLEYAALAAGAPALFPGDDPAAVAATLRLAPAAVLAAPSVAAADLVDDLAADGIDLSGLRALLLVGAPSEPERQAAEAAVTAVAPGARVLAVHAPAGARVLWAECAPRSGLHTYPDLEVVQTVDAETGEPAEAGPVELVLTQLGMRGSALLRWRTGDLLPAAVETTPCLSCGRRVPRVPSTLRRAALVRTDGAAPVDLRAVTAAVVGRADVADWRVVLGRRSRDRRPTLVVHLVPTGDPAQVTIGLAADVRAAAGVPPTQLVATDPAGLAGLAGRPLTRRVLLAAGRA